jgi:hypothetical protein
VRDDALDPRRFLAIVREHGVLAAVRSAPTTVPRSTTASAGLATIPVYVIDPAQPIRRPRPPSALPQIVTIDQCATLTDAQCAEDTVSL